MASIELSPLRSLGDFLLDSARFQVPQINDPEKWSHRVLNNLLYYQTNYFLIALFIFLIVGLVSTRSLDVDCAAVQFSHKTRKNAEIIEMFFILGRKTRFTFTRKRVTISTPLCVLGIYYQYQYFYKKTCPPWFLGWCDRYHDACLHFPKFVLVSISSLVDLEVQVSYFTSVTKWTCGHLAGTEAC